MTDGYVPTLNKDHLLPMNDALKLTIALGDAKHVRALVNLVKAGKIRVWLCADGKVRFQSEPELKP